VRIAEVRKPERVTAGAGGIRELEIPGVRAEEALRPPVLAERAFAGDAGLSYVFTRTTGDDPFRRAPERGSAGAALVRDRGDGERRIVREIAPPVARTFELDGWASPPGRDVTDQQLDAFVGVRGSFGSSSRFQGRPGFRASSAFDGTPRPWVGHWPSHSSVFLEWEGPEATISTLTLDPVPGVRRPTLVRVVGDDGATPPLEVRDGVVRLPAPMRSARVRLEILRAAFPPGTPGAARQRRAVGIAEVRGAGVPRAEVPRRGPLPRACEAFAVAAGGATAGLRAAGTIEDFDAGRPLRVRGCRALPLPAGAVRVTAEGGVLMPYVLRLRSPGARAAATVPGRVLSEGTAAGGERTGIRLALVAPGRLVLAESFNAGRRASCDGRDLGAPMVGAAFGTAWRVPADCREVEITFAPDRWVRAGYAVSLVVAAVLLVLVLRGARRGRSPRAEELAEGVVARLPARQAALIAVPAALALGFVFAARGVPLFALGVFFVLWRGIGVRALALAGGALLGVVVPLLYVLLRPENRGGYNPEYAIELIWAHWAAVAGVTLFVLALSRAMAQRGRAPAAPPSGAAPPRSGP